MDNGVGSGGIDFFGTGRLKVEKMTTNFDKGHLHAKAETKKGDAMLASVLNGGDFTLGTPGSPTLGNN